ncbi:MAG: AI-2E family transporter [Bacteroidales bacterium]|jgi:Predicted permease|nr:AI-2E family transporter [Bacteroidales bacterium]
MEQERSIDRLARYLIGAGTLAILAWLCWYFKSVLVYVIVAFVVSLIGQPVMRMLRKVTVRGKSAPDWLLAILTILLILGILILVVTQAIPVVTRIVRDAAVLNSATVSGNPLDRVNDWIIGLFPALGPDFDLIDILMDKLRDVTNITNVTAVISSVTSFVTSFAVGLFSIVFISFFFVRDETLFRKIVCALVPDRMEGKIAKALGDIEHLLSRYFVGLLIEMTGVALLDFLGLWLIARLGFSNALGIAFIAGILNIIPYVGPLIGEAVGVILAVILKYGTGVGLGVNIWVFALIVLAIMLTTQFVDNFVYQPLIYSTSIKASPLEIFIVILLAGHIGGVVGMLVAIPAYTVVRVIASRFFRHVKPVRKLMPDLDREIQ